MSDKDLDYAMDCNQQAIYEFTDLVARQDETIFNLREQVKVLRAALGSYAECCDGCTCGDGWSHDIAIEALEQTKPKEGE